ncbi:MAG: hypothetical protein M0Z66_00370 [Thermaerobacter sp.]|nr:hypothetical protein [Thermaerobacter sp.]
MGAIYDRCKTQVKAIEQAYDALMEEIDAYDRVLSELGGDDEELRIALSMQANGLGKLRDTLEGEALDNLIRFSDRVIRLKHWEDGMFV